MKRIRPYGTLVALAVALAAITATTVIMVNHADQHGTSVTVTHAGAAVLTMSIAVVVIAGRAFVRQVRRERDRDGRLMERRECPACDREVHGAWRMCPYCGALVDEDRNGEVPA